MSVQVSARSRPRRKLAGFAALMLVAGLSVAALGPLGSNASSHREAPLVSADPQVDATDLYAFRSPDAPKKVTIVSNWIPFQEPAGGPNFYPWATNTRYDVNIDNDGDAKPDVIYRWVFKNHRRNPNSFIYNNGPVTSLNDPNLLQYQTYDLRRIRVGRDVQTILNDKIAAPSHVGEASMPDYEDDLMDAAVRSFENGESKSFVGQSDDPFFLDLRVFDLLYGGPGFTETIGNPLAVVNVNTIALQAPRWRLAKSASLPDNPNGGIWNAASPRSTRIKPIGARLGRPGEWVQVSRLGMPLVNEVVIPIKDKDRFNASKPVNDGRFLDYVLNPELPELVEAVHGVAAPDTCPNNPDSRCRTDLVQVFLTGLEGINQPPGVRPSEQLRINLKTPVCTSGCSDLGVIGGDVQGFPNGRRLTDDTIDIALQVVEGELVGNPNNLGDGVDENDAPFESSFPYVAPPHAGSEAEPHAAGP